MKKELTLRAVLFGALCTSFGMSFIWPLTSVYLHDNLHLSLAIVGIVLFFNSLASVIGNVVGGIFFDRFNPYWLLQFGGWLMFFTLVILTFYHGIYAFSICLFFLGLGAGWNGTVVSALGASLKQYDGRYVFNMIYFVQNLGIVIGSSVVGFLYDWQIRLPFLVSTLVSVGFLSVVFLGYRVLKHEVRKQDKHSKKALQLKLPKSNAWLMYSLLFSLFLMWVMYQQWGSNVSVYMTSMHIPFRYYSMLWTVNAGLIVCIQFFIVRFGHVIKNHFLPIYGGVGFFAISFVVLLFAKSYPMFVLAMVILTLGEAWALPQVPVVVNELTPEGSKGKYLGLANSFGSAGRAVAPLFGGLLIEFASYQLLFVIAALVNACLILFLWIVKRLLEPSIKYYD